mgnify:FL=1
MKNTQHSDHFKNINRTLKNINKSLLDIKKSLVEFNYINQSKLNNMPTCYPVVDNKKNYYLRDESSVYDFMSFRLGTNNYEHNTRLTGSEISQQQIESMICCSFRQELFLGNISKADFCINLIFNTISCFKLKSFDKELGLIPILIFYGFNSRYNFSPHYYPTCKSTECSRKQRFLQYELSSPLLYKTYTLEGYDNIPSWRELMFTEGQAIVE